MPNPTGPPRSDLPAAPAGWRLEGSAYRAVTTIAGGNARGVRVLGRCRAPGCGRRCEIRFHELERLGFAQAEVSGIQAQFACGRPGGCQLQWDGETYPLGVPLVSLFYETIMVKCRACTFGRPYSGRELAERLRLAGSGGLSTGINQVVERIRGKCACGRFAWEVAVERR